MLAPGLAQLAAADVRAGGQGVISVEPQAVMIGMSNSRRKYSITAAGVAEPPSMMARTLDRSRRWRLSSVIMSMPMLTAAAANVTRSACIRSRIAGACGRAPGNTILAPMQAAANGRPQALAWNIGTTGSRVSRSRMSSTSPRHSVRVCR